MVTLELEFEWDLSKEQLNVSKHGYNFSDAVLAFKDTSGLLFRDVKHSAKESRFYWVGIAKDSIVLTVWFTRRGNKIRIIGCAEWRKFKRIYYEATKA